MGSPACEGVGVGLKLRVDGSPGRLYLLTQQRFTSRLSMAWPSVRPDRQGCDFDTCSNKYLSVSRLAAVPSNPAASSLEMPGNARSNNHRPNNDRLGSLLTACVALSEAEPT